MKTILYFHGLGSSAASRKFVSLQQVFADNYKVVCPEWSFTTDIQLMLANLLKQYESHTSIIMIGSSTGCNFAYQLTMSLRAKGVKVKLLMINPLLLIKQRISLRAFPVQLANYLSEIREVDHCTLILSTQDEIIDHSMISIGEDVDVISIKDNHQVSDLQGLIGIIQNIIEKI